MEYWGSNSRGITAALGRDRSVTGFDPEWKSYSHYWMISVLTAKIRHNPGLEMLLRVTGHKILIENTVRANYTDNIWGAGPDGVGESRLGICWMC